jgi:hypothetical protein
MVESRDPRVHAELLAGLQRLAPEAFRDLAITFGERLAVLDPQAFQQVSAAMAAQVAPPSSVGARHVVPQQPPTAPGLAPAAGATAANQFLATVNTSVEQAVQSSVTGRVAELLPDAPEGARQKISGEIFRELDQTLRRDPELLEQVRESVRAALRSGAASQTFGTSREPAGRVAQLIAARARAALPSVAKRVVADWTETVLRSSQARRSRQSESASRVEVGRGSAPAPVPLKPRGVDYARMSDEEILNLD